MRTLSFLAAIGFMIGCGSSTLLYGQGHSTDPLEIKFRKLKNDIYLAYRPETLRYWVEGNVVIIINDRDVVVVDASGAPRSARAVIAYIKRLTNRPVRYLINTHGHGDHTIGNQEYVKAFPGVEIIAHEGTAEYIAGRGYNYVDEIAQSTESRKTAGETEIEQLSTEGKPGNEKIMENLIQYYRHDIDIRQAEYKTVRRTPPTAIVNESLRLHRDNRVIEILYLGAGNTQSDLVVYLPNDGIVCAGDMVTEPVPFGFSRYPLEWLQTLKRLSQLDFDTLVPGHGEVQEGKKYLERFISLFESLQGQVEDGMEDGEELEGVRKRIDVSAYEQEFAGDDPVIRYYFGQYFTIPAVERTFNALRDQRSKEKQ